MYVRKNKPTHFDWLRERSSHSDDGCLVWPFSTNGTGYGTLGRKGRIYYAHRVMCEMIRGPAPSPDHEAAHSCGNGQGGCVNPKHLTWKTRSENQLDRRGHGTAVTSTWGNRGKLTEEQKSEIRALRGKVPQRSLAALYGVHFETISRVQRTQRRPRKMKDPFTTEQVLEIRRIGRGKTLEELAAQFGGSMSAVRNVRIGKTYKDVS